MMNKMWKLAWNEHFKEILMCKKREKEGINYLKNGGADEILLGSVRLKIEKVIFKKHRQQSKWRRKRRLKLVNVNGSGELLAKQYR